MVDIDGDCLNGLIARDKDRDLWRCSSQSTGPYAPGVKIGWAWQTYKSRV